MQDAGDRSGSKFESFCLDTNSFRLIFDFDFDQRKMTSLWQFEDSRPGS